MQRYLVNFDFEQLEKRKCDCLVIGSGIAGLYTALKAGETGKVILLTKQKLEDCTTEFAQGGIAAAIDEADSPSLHLNDTLEAGAGINDLDAVSVLVNEGPERVMDLISLGAIFDKVDGELALTKEAAHSRRRILHARGDATGEEIRRALAGQVRRAKAVQIQEDTFVVDLLTKDHKCFGVLAMEVGTGRLVAYLANATVVATGGAGRLYQNTTNPNVATGDGIAVAYRAGAEIMDIEFMQFHPTALYLENAPENAPRFLISEAVRGEGAILRNIHGKRFMPDYHPLAELAPRDIVARSILDQMQKTGAPYVYLDTTPIGDEVEHRFPNIYETCKRYNIDLRHDWIPVAPVAHYLMGGIRTDIYGRTNIQGLFACGETACNGVHGANRLASNSLLDGLVFGYRIAQEVAKHHYCITQEEINGFTVPPVTGLTPVEIDVEKYLQAVRKIMWEKVGILRDGPRLQKAIEELEEIAARCQGELKSVPGMELQNMLVVGRLTAKAALLRQESRGGHHRLDYPTRDDFHWKKHSIAKWQD